MLSLAETEVIVIVALALTLVTLLIHSIAVIAPYWIYRDDSGTQYYQGLWQSCTNVDSTEQCQDISVKSDWLEAAEALEIVGIILIGLVVIGFFIHIFILRGDRVLYIILAITLFLAGIFIIIGAAIYAGNASSDVGTVHFAFALSLAASVLAAITAFVMILYLLLTASSSKSDEEWREAGPSNSQWIAPRTRSAHQSRVSIINDTDEAEQPEDRPKTAKSAHARSSARARSTTQSERQKNSKCCWCCCPTETLDSDDDRENQQGIEERQEEDQILQDYDENDEMVDATENQTSNEQNAADKPEDKGNSKSSTDNQEPKGSEKQGSSNNQETESPVKETNEGSQNFKSVHLVDITEQEETEHEENVIVLNKEEDAAVPTESNTDPDESLYAPVHPEQQSESDHPVTSGSVDVGSKVSLKEGETVVVVPEEDVDENGDTRKKRGTVFKFRRPPLNRSKSDGTVLKAKVQLYEVSKNNKMVLVSSDYVPDEDIQSLSRSASEKSVSGNEHTDESASEGKHYEETRELSDIEDDEFDENLSSEYRTIKIRTKKRTKRVKVKGIFGNPVESPYGYTTSNAEHGQLVKYLKSSPYFSSVLTSKKRAANDNQRPNWKI